MRSRTRVGWGFACLVACAPWMAIQLRATAPDPPPTTIKVALSAGSRSYSYSGPGECTHLAHGGIFGLPAANWAARHHDASRAVNLAFWRPTGKGGDLFTLSLSFGSTTYQVSTAKGPDGGALAGTGTISFAPSTAGGTFTVDATDKSGVAITGTISCSAFPQQVEDNG